MLMPGLLRSRRGALGVSLLLVLVWVLLHNQIVGMDGRFFRLSPAGVNGLFLYLVGDYVGAARSYRAHLKSAIQNGETLGDPALDALAAGALHAAEATARRTLRESPASTDALLTLAEVALARGDHGRAHEPLDRVLARQPDQFDALLLRSIAQTRAGEHGAAIDTLNRAFRTNTLERRPTAFLTALETVGELAARQPAERPLCLLAHYYRYLTIVDSSNTRLAIHFATEAIAAGDRPADAYLTLGIVSRKTGNRERALEAFLEAVKTDPRHAEAHRWAAAIYGERGDVPNEYRMARGAFLAAPGDSFYLRVYHKVLTEKLGDYRQALAITQQALATAPNVDVHSQLGYLYGFLGDDERSVTHYRQAAALDPGNPALLEGIGNGLRNLGRTDEAIVAYQRALALAPRRARTYRLLATVYQDRGRWEDAIREYEQARALGEREGALVEHLCALYHVTSRFAQAEECFQAVLAADPHNPRALRLLPEIRENLRLQGARR
jgi:tetratricopeptide (TPR) repeat protein